MFVTDGGDIVKKVPKEKGFLNKRVKAYWAQDPVIDHLIQVCFVLEMVTGR
jgi:hypothetical protein